MTKEMKKRWFRAIFVAETCLFLCFYLFGSQGLRKVWQLQAENEEFERSLQVLNQEIATIEHQIVAFNTHPFYKEKLAREQLQMARPEETIYYLN